MIKQGIKNYFTGLKYFFIPLGTMFLGMMIGVSIFVPRTVSAVNTLADGIGKLSESVNLDFGTLFNHLWAMVTSLNWEAPEEALNTLFSMEWLNSALTEALNTILGTDFEVFKTEIINLVSFFTAELVLNAAVFFIMWLLGYVAGAALIKFLIRRKIARRSLWKFILALVIDSVLTAVITAICAWLFVLWQSSIWISVLLSMLIVSIFALFEAYLVHGYNIVEIKSVINIKNVGMYILTNALVFIMSVCFSLIITAINGLVGLFAGLTLMLIAFTVISMNAESYVLDYVKENAENKE